MMQIQIEIYIFLDLETRHLCGGYQIIFISIYSLMQPRPRHNPFRSRSRLRSILLDLETRHPCGEYQIRLLSTLQSQRTRVGPRSSVLIWQVRTAKIELPSIDVRSFLFRSQIIISIEHFDHNLDKSKKKTSVMNVNK